MADTSSPDRGTNKSEESPVIRRGAIRDEAMFRRYGCDVPNLSPPTPDRVTPDRVVNMNAYMGLDIPMPDGTTVEMWVFFDPSHPEEMSFPPKTIRVRQGEVVHTNLDALHVHTVHHHGIEGTPFNDGVGHTSFQVARKYAYQWMASQAGTYLYHCHVNTVLHFEMGMYGLLIVDPPEGPGRAYGGGPEYDVEAFWIADEIDPRWHRLDERAGVSCAFSRQNPGLNRFEPEFFLITGVPHPWTRNDPKAAIRARPGETILVRAVNAGYTIQEFVIEGIDAEVVSIDGRPLAGPYSEPLFLPAGTPFELTTAQRYDLILRPARPGRYPATVKFRDWISREVLGVAQTFIHIQPD